MDTQLLAQVIADQHETFQAYPFGVTRDVNIPDILQTPRIIVITGIRRSGKSILLKQIAAKVDSYYYINFDDERLFHFEVADFQSLMFAFQKRYAAKTILIDEVQNVQGWERFARRLYDENYKVVITGSNAKLLSSELATHLTGRYRKIELFPFSFSEYLRYKAIPAQPLTTKNTARIVKAFDDYLVWGGFPEYVYFENTEDLQNTYSDILYKDLIVRFGVKNQKAFKNLAMYLFRNFTGEISYNSLKSITGISNTNTIKDYIDYLQQAYLVFEVHKFEYSLKKLMAYAKKTYAIDNGMRNTVAFRISKEHGQLLENLVFIELKKRYQELWFYKSETGFEVDFLINDPPLHLFQVSYTLQDERTRNREIRGLVAAMEALGTGRATIITYNEETVLSEAGYSIEVIPAWKWCMGMHNT